MFQSEFYWEQQESGFCAVHCVNNVLQGAYFNEQDLAQIALELDDSERRLMLESGADSAEYLSYMSRDSVNLDDAGNFSVDVLRRALSSLGLSLDIVRRQELNGSALLHETAFILNGHSHWYAIRKINDEFFNLDSLPQNGPRKIGDFYLSAYLQQMLMDGWSVFAIRGSLPQPSKALSDNGRGEWISVRSVTHSGRVAPASAPHSNSVMAIDDDDELQRALALSMETHVIDLIEAPRLPVLDEVPEHEPNALNLMIRMPNGANNKRRFRATDSVQTVLHYALSCGLPASTSYQVVSTFPRHVLQPLTASLTSLGIQSGSVLVIEKAS